MEEILTNVWDMYRKNRGFWRDTTPLVFGIIQQSDICGEPCSLMHKFFRIKRYESMAKSIHHHSILRYE